MFARSCGYRLLAAIAVASLLGACASSGAPTVPSASSTSPPTTPHTTPTVLPTQPPAPTVVATTAPTPGATPTKVPTVAPTAIAYGPVSVFSGLESCSVDFGTITGEGTEVQHAREGSAACMDTTTDPRMTGRYTAAWNVDYWGTPDKQNGALVQWGTGRLTNDGGSWDGRAAGVYSSDEGDTIVWWWTGTGGYAGLAAFELVTGTQPWKVQGQIFPGTPPDPASVAPPTTTATFPPSHLKTPPPVPTAAVYGPTSVFSGTEQCDVSKMMGNMTDAGDGLTQWRDGTVLCGDTVNDARMSGAYSATWNIDHWPDDALVQWGNARFANSGGAWTGLGSGVYSPDRGDIIVWWWTGTEGYAGLAAFEAVTGSGTWAIEGQIFPGSPPQP